MLECNCHYVKMKDVERKLKLTINIPFEKAIYLPSEGAKVGILLLHAYTGTAKDMNLLGRHLHKLGYSVLCPNFSGHWSDNIFDLLNASPFIWLEEAQAAFDWLNQQGFEKIFVFGLSMGGIMATSLIADPLNSIDGGGIFNSPVVTVQRTDVSKAFMGYAKHLARTTQTMAQYENEEEKIRQAHWKQMDELEQVKQTIKTKLANIDQAFYIAQSAKDELIDPDDAYELQDELINAKIDFHWFSENTHVITVNRDRVDFENSVIRFIADNT